MLDPQLSPLLKLYMEKQLVAFPHELLLELELLDPELLLELLELLELELLELELLLVLELLLLQEIVPDDKLMYEPFVHFKTAMVDPDVEVPVPT